MYQYEVYSLSWLYGIDDLTAYYHEGTCYDAQTCYIFHILIIIIIKKLLPYPYLYILITFIKICVFINFLMIITICDFLSQYNTSQIALIIFN